MDGARATNPQEASQFNAVDESDPGIPDGDLYLLRLALDAQLDTALLIVGAIARNESDADLSYDRTGPIGPELQRWLQQDIGLVQLIATRLLNVGMALPMTLGPSSDGLSDYSLIEDLIARCESMSGILRDLKARLESRNEEADRPRPTALSPISSHSIESLIEVTERRHEELLNHR
jgi:hypothetical protein